MLRANCRDWGPYQGRKGRLSFCQYFKVYCQTIKKFTKIDVNFCYFLIFCICKWKMKHFFSFFFCSFFFFNWRLITLQYCHGFCHSFTWNSHGGVMCSPSWTPHPPLSPSHPSGSSQCTSPEHPVSCIQPGLAIYFTYDNIHVSMLFSHIFPPLPSPTESKRLFFTSVYLLLSCIQDYHYHLPNSIYMR